MNPDIRARTLLKSFVKVGVIESAIAGAVLFGLAGRVDWPAGWLVMLLLTGHLVLSGWLLLRHDPELLKERLTIAPNVPRWDRLIGPGIRIVLLIFLATAALDAGRFRWSTVPMIVRAIGTAALLAAIGAVYWCAAANRFLSARSRIQTDRGHTVVQHGPYRFVRHPLYAARIVQIIGLALTLGSWLALVPAVLNALLLVLRTALEDRMLTAELPGYREYATRVPRRLVPGLW
ncbi:MAG TPA: isoprenylcysteine carboxylmethyltransferase family protein [Vicinamibacterales bacterium]|nr:isoprenylcysteine carboxylmethyltransferase family protein [Vicinamibacterales bacterium]